MSETVLIQITTALTGIAGVSLGVFGQRTLQDRAEKRAHKDKLRQAYAQWSSQMAAMASHHLRSRLLPVDLEGLAKQPEAFRSELEKMIDSKVAIFLPLAAARDNLIMLEPSPSRRKKIREIASRMVDPSRNAEKKIDLGAVNSIKNEVDALLEELAAEGRFR